MKNIKFICMVVISVLCISCGLREKMGEYETEQRDMISKEYWGTWIRMDTGTEYYIDSISKWETSSSNKKYRRLSYGLSGHALDFNSNDVMIDGEQKIYFRKGGSARSFSATLSGFSEISSNASISGFSRAATTNNGVRVKRENVNNTGDTETVTSGTDGKIVFGEVSTGTTTGSGAVADDEQKISIEQEGVATGTVSVTPAYDGENIGSIPIIPKNMYGFKTTYTINGDEQGYLFGGKNYTLNLKITNVGEKDCDAFEYNVYCLENSGLTVTGSSQDKKNGIQGIHQTLEPGKSMNLKLTVSYAFTAKKTYEEVPIYIDIYEPTTGVWKDSVTLRFYNGYVPLTLKAVPPTNGSYVTLNGFLIYPDGRSKRFTVSARSSSPSTVAVEIPWSTDEYLLAFSGAQADTEMMYSFGIGSVEPGDFNSFGVNELIAYEPNDSVGQAQKIDVTKPVNAYLKKNDIDFYRINVSGVSVN